MKTMFIPMVLLLALGLPALADKGGKGDGWGDGVGGGKGHGAPAPIVAGGLPPASTLAAASIGW